jgi:hypothetical protein
MSPPTPRLQDQCDRFNIRHEIGQSVRVDSASGDPVETTTRSRARVLPSGRAAVILVHGIKGSVLLDRVTPIDGAPE